MEELIAIIKADIRDFKAKMDEVASKLQNVQQKFQKIGKSASKYITVPVLAAGAASFKMASDYQESLNKVDVAFKDSSDEIKKWSETTLKSFGIASGTALDMAALYGDMATSMGFNAQQSAKMSMELVGLAGDMASFKNISIDIANTALKSIFTGETESLKTLGIVMTEANVKAWMLSQGIKGNYEKMDQAQKVAIRYQYVMAQTANSQGDFARTGGGAANQMRIMWESLKELAVTFGNVLLPTITNIIKKINEWLESLRNTSPELKKMIIVIAAIAAAIGPLSLALSGILKIVPAIVASFSVLTPHIAAITIAVSLAVAGFSLFKKKTDESTKAISDINMSIALETSKMNYLFKAIQSAGEGTDKRNRLIKIANERYKDYLPFLLKEADGNERIALAHKEAAKAMVASMAVKAADQKITELQAKSQEKILDAFKRKRGRFNQDILGDFGEKAGTDVMQEMITALDTAVSIASEEGYTKGKEIGVTFWNKWFKGFNDEDKDKFKFDEFILRFMTATRTKKEFDKQISIVDAFAKNYRDKVAEIISSAGEGDGDGGKITGIITQLQKKIKGLEEKKLTLFDENSIKETQRQIDILKNELEDSTNWKGGELTPLKTKGLGENALTKDLKVTAEALQDLNKEYVSITEVSENFGGVVKKTFRQATSSTNEVIGELQEFSINMNAIFEDLAESTITAFASEIGNVIGGGDFGLDRILIMFADWAIKLGSILIAAGIAIESFKEQILEHPLAVAALGAALVAAGAAVKAAVQTNPTSSSGSGSSSNGGRDNWDAFGERNLRGKIEVQVNGVLKGNGRDLYGVITKENVRRSL